MEIHNNKVISTCVGQGPVSDSDGILENRQGNGYKEGSRSRAEPILPGFRFHPTDEELVGFYLLYKVLQRPLAVEVITQLDIYKFDPWDLPKMAAAAKGERECYFFCRRDRKYRNSARPNRVTGAGFWKATGTDRPIYSSTRSAAGSSQSEGSIKCIGLKKSLVFYRGRAAKGFKTDWMMHEFRLPSPTSDTPGVPHLEVMSVACSLQADSWALCRIFKKSGLAHRPMQPPSDFSKGSQPLYWPEPRQVPQFDGTETMPDSPPEDPGTLELWYDQLNGSTKSGHGKETSDASSVDHDVSDPSECNSNEGPGTHESTHLQRVQAPAQRPQLHKYNLYAAEINNLNNVKQEDVELQTLKANSHESENNLEKVQHQQAPSLWANGEAMSMKEDWISKGEERPGSFTLTRVLGASDVLQNKVLTLAPENLVTGPGKYQPIGEEKPSSRAAHTELDLGNKENDNQHLSASSPIPSWVVQLPRIPSFGGMLGMDEWVKTMDTTNGAKISAYDNSPGATISLDTFNSFLMDSSVVKGSMDSTSTTSAFNTSSEPTRSHHDHGGWSMASNAMVSRMDLPSGPFRESGSSMRGTCALSGGLEYARKELSGPHLQIPTAVSSYNHVQPWDLSSIFDLTGPTTENLHSRPGAGLECM